MLCFAASWQSGADSSETRISLIFLNQNGFVFRLCYKNWRFVSSGQTVDAAHRDASRDVVASAGDLGDPSSSQLKKSLFGTMRA